MFVQIKKLNEASDGFMIDPLTQSPLVNVVITENGVTNVLSKEACGFIVTSD